MPKLLVGEAGRVLFGRGPDVVRYYIDRGKLPAERTASGVRIVDLDDVLRLKRELAARRPRRETTATTHPETQDAA